MTKFLVFTDLHVDIMHDGVARMQVILEEAKAKSVEFIIHLGDIMYPDTGFLASHGELENRTGWFANDRDDEKLAILKMIEESGLRVYGVLGNHDMDSCTKATACAYWDMPAPYYVFERGGLRFIALDTNNILNGETLIDYDHCNYRNFRGGNALTWLGKEQLSWLEEQIMTSSLPCVLLSHAALGDEMLNAHDGPEVWEIVRRCNADRRRVIFAMNGHNHIDGVCVRSGVPFMSVNSASNIWIGHKYDCVRYSETISKIYHHMTGCAPYMNTLYAVITVDGDAIRVRGVKSRFVGPSPYDLGFPRTASYHISRPCIRDRDLPLTAMPEEGLIDYED